MMKGIIAIATISMLTFSQAFACDLHGKGGFLPENSHRISVDDKMANDMTKEKFISLIDRVAAIYTPLVEKQAGVPFIINRRWDDDIVNAYAAQFQASWRVTMYGGLARHPMVTDDAFMMVICHEIGHHIGGAPKAYSNTHWATNEGQADYFAALKCMKKILSTDDNVSIVAGMKIEPIVTKECQGVYKSANEIAMCERIGTAAKALTMMMASYTENTVVNFSTPDRSKVTATKDEHPEPQCRLDTFFQGSLCDKSDKEEVSSKDPIPGTCIAKDGYTVGVRPLCWYKPTALEI